MEYTSSVRIERQIYDLNGLHQVLDYEKPKKKVCSNFPCSSCKPGRFLLNSLPILSWLPQYQWKQDLVNDLISGFTVAIMHIPQGMAYALLGNVPPIIGIYMAFFPVIVYFLLGTSKHNSMGTFAIICLMTGKVVLEVTQEQTNIVANFRSNLTDTTGPIIIYTPVEIAAAVTFIVAIFQLVMYVFRLGIVSTLLSETLVNGFTTGAAFHVLVSQIKDLFGLHLPRHKGAFTVINTLISIFREITNLNVTAIIISVITITVCVVNNEFLKPRVSKISAFPIPIELLVVVTGTLVSNHWNFSDVYSVNIIGDIPSGIPAPTIPHLSLFSAVAYDGVIIAIVAYTITLSMGMIFAQKLGYEVDANQELLAQGAGNLVGSFFSCMPFSASLSRSLIQQTVGGKTQLASLVSCFLLLFVLLWIGPFFKPLPKSVLASVIVVALKGMLMQITSLKKFWSLSKLDGTVWIITFLTTVIINVDVGLMVGLIVSILTVMILGMKPYTCVLGSVPNTDLYVDTSRYRKAVELPNIKIFHYCGGINFATKNYFKSELYRLIGVDPQKELVKRMKFLKETKAVMGGVENIAFEEIPYHIDEKITVQSIQQLKAIIIDFSALSYIDPSSVTTIKIIVENYQKINIPVLIAGCSGPVYEMMQKCDLLKNVDLLRIFPTVHDAVLCTLPNVDITSL